MQTVERAVSEALILTAADTEKPDIFLIAKRHGFFTGETLLLEGTDAFLVSNTGAGIRYMAFEAHPKSKVIIRSCTQHEQTKVVTNLPDHIQTLPAVKKFILTKEFRTLMNERRTPLPKEFGRG